MTFKQKRRSKKLAIIYFTAAYAMIVLFIALVVLSATNLIDIAQGNEDAQILTVLIGVSPLFACIFLSMFGSWSSMKRTSYRFKIKQYREFRNFNFIIDYLQAGELQKARDLFDSLPQGSLRVFVNGLILGYRMLSDDAEIKANAEDKMNILREDFSHYNITFK